MIRAHNSMKVLITGTTGWLGGELAKKLAAQGHTVVGLARRATEIENVMSVQADLEDGASITRAINEHGPFDVVVHLAGCLGSCDLAQAIDVNVAGTRRVVQAAADAGCTFCNCLRERVTCSDREGRGS